MPVGAYYNENDPKMAAWLRELIKEGLIADGEVDDRSIVDVLPTDLKGYAQCHFFAGIGGWSYALRLAGWPDDRPAWTGSCPCQPFSSAGAQVGGDDPRHLWPAWYQFIAQCQPPVVFGEQVESAIGHGWLDLVCDDLEREGYAVGAVGLPAASVGAFHIRQRLWFVADRDGSRCRPRRPSETSDGRDQTRIKSSGLRAAGDMADSEDVGLRQRPTVARGRIEGVRAQGDRIGSADAGGNGLGNTSSQGLQERERLGRLQRDTLEPSEREAAERGSDIDKLANANSAEREACQLQSFGATEARSERITSPGLSDFWSAVDWIPCRDGKSRPVESGTFPLAHGVSSRVVKLRGYGNAIVPEVAAEMIRTYLEIQ